ncbi:hypothetical protein DFH06DRAFT_1297169 [Mycena polygramma]|nr:hypothetical protein DFH06DRAFT_1297169 [Mycena polygramma]
MWQPSTCGNRLHVASISAPDSLLLSKPSAAARGIRDVRSTQPETRESRHGARAAQEGYVAHCGSCSSGARRRARCSSGACLDSCAQRAPWRAMPSPCLVHAPVDAPEWLDGSGQKTEREGKEREVRVIEGCGTRTQDERVSNAPTIRWRRVRTNARGKREEVGPNAYNRHEASTTQRPLPLHEKVIPVWDFSETSSVGPVVSALRVRGGCSALLVCLGQKSAKSRKESVRSSGGAKGNSVDTWEARKVLECQQARGRREKEWWRVESAVGTNSNSDDYVMTRPSNSRWRG